MKCPRCENVELEIGLEGKTVEVDHCPNCGGVWLDSGELEEVIRQRNRAQQNLMFERHLLRALLEHAPDRIYFKDRDSTFVRVSSAKAQELGVPASEVEGKTDFDFYPPKVAAAMLRDDMDVMESGEPIVGKTQKRTGPDGDRRWFSVTKTPRYEDNGNIVGTLGIERDITALMEAQEKLAELSSTDELTGAANRRHLNEELEVEVARAHRTGHAFGVLMIDLDFFKGINDEQGHQVGDRLLKRCAELIQRNVRETDFVGRYGGDEFCVILPETDPQGAELVAEKLRKSVENSEDLPMTISVGLAIWEPGYNTERMLRQADKALYEAKDDGRNLVRVAE
ncbi:MAG: diguanylate cyclase [Candidatus Brocadiia bacterium]